MKNFFKQKKVSIVCVCAILLTIFCIVQMITPKQSYHYYGEMVFENGIAQPSAVIYQQIELPMGIYDIQLEYQTNTNMKNLCTITDGTVFTGGLLTNGEHLHENLNNTDFRIWLFENTSSLQVIASYSGEGYLITGNLSIHETNLLWILLLVLVWSVTFLIIGILFFKSYDKTVGIEKENKTVLFGLFVIILIASLPYLQGATMSGADLVYHLHRIEGVKDGILSGQFPLRLEPEWLYGHGYANGVFYCNTLLYFPAILRLLGFTVTASYNMYCIALNIGTAFISYFCFQKIFENRYIGLLCSAFYTLSIFRICKMVIMAALGEASAIMFMPLVLYGLYRAFTEDITSKSYQTVWIPIAVGYAGLIQTHVLSCEITAFLTILICLIGIKKVFVRQTFCELAKGALAAFIMSFWYLVPFFDYYINENMHIRHVSGRTIQNRGLYFPQLFFNWWKMGNNAILGDFGMEKADAMGVGFLLGMALFVFCILWFLGAWKQQKERILSLGKISCIFGILLLVMSLNIFPWDKIQNINGITASLVSSLQFPHRFLGWGTVFLVTVCGCLFWYFEKSDQKWYWYLGVVCVFLSISTSSIYLLDYICRDKEYVYLYNEEGMGFGYISGAEYLIEGTQQGLLGFAKPSVSEEVEMTSYEKEYLHVWLSCVNDSSKQGYIELPLLHYKGYRAYVVSTGEELETTKGTNNVVRVFIPAGFQGDVEVKFVSPISWRISEIVTYVWYVFMAVNGIRYLRRKQREKRENGYG